jgi:hypothetical protein
MVASAQLKLVLDNTWDLAQFDNVDPRARLNIRVQRAHRRSITPLAEARAG